MKLFIRFLVVGLVSLQLSAMELPEAEARGVKRGAPEAPEVPEESEELETPAKKGREFSIAEKVQELKEKAGLQKLPHENLLKILEYMETAQGFGSAKLTNAATNIRNYLLSMKSLWPYLYDVDFNGALIKELARRYAGGVKVEYGREWFDAVEPAVALHTKGASDWLRNKLIEYKGVYAGPGGFSPMAKDVVLRAIRAMKRNQHDLANFLLQSATSPNPNELLIPVNIYDIDHFTLLKAAAQSGNTGNLARVLKLKPDVNLDADDSFPALYYAIEQGNMDNIRALLNAGAVRIWHEPDGEISITALIQAASKKNLPLIELLLTYPDVVAQINAMDIGEAQTALVAAIVENDASIVQRLLQVPGITKDGDPVATAIALNNKDMLELLLRAGANPNIPDSENVHPIFAAVEKDIPDIDSATLIDMLDRFGADVNQAQVLNWHISFGQITARQEVKTPLMEAAKKGKVKSAEALLKAGANPMVQDKEGHTALWYAQQSTGPNKDVMIRILQKEEQKWKEKK